MSAFQTISGGQFFLAKIIEELSQFNSDKKTKAQRDKLTTIQKYKKAIQRTGIEGAFQDCTAQVKSYKKPHLKL